jgi:microcystin-dependent protein
MDPLMGTILMCGLNFAPRGWMFCNGQTLSISQNSALFALLGTTFGGNGTTTFQLPNLQGRVPVGVGNGAGLEAIQLGQVSGVNSVTVSVRGTANVTLTSDNLPAHTHGGSGLTGATSVSVSTGGGGALMPSAGSVLTNSVPGVPSAAAIYAPSASNPVNLGGVTTTVSGTTASTGSGLAVPVLVNSASLTPVSIMQPYVGMNFIIAVQGIFPSRN